MASATSIETQVKQIRSDIKNKTLAPVYLLTGEEQYYIDLICTDFENKVVDEASRDFDQAIVFGKQATASLLISLCRQYPLMSDKRLVVLKEAQLMDKGQWAKLLIYLQSSQPSTTFVICNKADKFDTKCKNAISKNGGVVVESAKLKDYQVPKWIANFVASKKYKIDDLCANMICEYLGNDLQKVANEINKMILNIHDRVEITQNDITEFIGVSKEYNVFELQNALSKKDVMKVNTIINYFEQNPKENPIQSIMPILFSYFNKLLIASQVPSRMDADIAAALNLRSPFFAKDYVAALNYYSTKQLLDIVALFNEYDLKSKGIGASPLLTEGNLLREFVFKILHI